MEKSLFQQARDAVMNLTNRQGEINEQEKETVRRAIQAAYNRASPEEKQELEQFEQQINQRNQLY